MPGTETPRPQVRWNFSRHVEAEYKYLGQFATDLRQFNLAQGPSQAVVAEMVGVIGGKHCKLRHTSLEIDENPEGRS